MSHDKSDRPLIEGHERKVMGIDHHRSEPCEGFVAPVGVDLSEEFQGIVGLTVGAMELLETKLQGYLCSLLPAILCIDIVCIHFRKERTVSPSQYVVLAYIHIYTYIYICVCVCMYVHHCTMYMYIVYK